MSKKVSSTIINWLPILISVIGFVSSYKFDITFVVLPNDSSFHFNLVTINALFSGFLFTSFSFMIGFLDNKIIDKLKGTDIIIRRNRHILKGIIFSIVSVCSSLLLILVLQSCTFQYELINCALCNVEITFMFFGIGYFLLSMKEMSSLVKILYSGNKIDPEIINMIDQTLDSTKH